MTDRYSIVVTLTDHGYQYFATDYDGQRSAKEGGFATERVAFGHAELVVARWQYGTAALTHGQAGAA